MARVFISYRRGVPDEDVMELVVGVLERAGIDCAVDKRIIHSGDWWNQIAQEMPLCDWFLVIQTPRSLDSSIVRKEVKLARTLVEAGTLKGIIQLVSEGPMEASFKGLKKDHRFNAIGNREATELQTVVRVIKGEPLQLSTPLLKVQNLFPHQYMPSRIARNDLIQRAFRKLEEHGLRVALLVGTPGVGKTALAYELCSLLGKQQAVRSVTTFTWTDAMGSSLEASQANLDGLITRDTPYAGRTLTSLSCDDLEGVFDDRVIVVNDLERGADTLSAKEITNSLFNVLTKYVEEARNAWIIVTSRPTVIKLKGREWDLSSEADGELTDAPVYALGIPGFDAQQTADFLAKKMVVLRRDLDLEKEDADSINSGVLAYFQDRAAAPLELRVACEIVARTYPSGESADAICDLLRKLGPPDFNALEEADPSDLDSMGHLVADRVLRSFYPIINYYLCLWDLIAGESDFEPLERTLEFAALGLLRSNVPIHVPYIQETLKTFIELPRDKAGADATGKDYIELTHPTVAYLCGLVRLPKRIASASPFADPEGNQVTDDERLLWSARYAVRNGTSPPPIPHAVTEREARASVLLFGEILGVYAELLTILVLPKVREKPEDPVAQRVARAKHLLTKTIKEKIVRKCTDHPQLTLTAARLGEVLYQQLDEWTLKEEIVKRLWLVDSLRPDCVQAEIDRDEGGEYGFRIDACPSILDWYNDPSVLLETAGLGKEFLRQSLVVQELEAGLAISIPKGDDLRERERQMEAWFASQTAPEARNAALAFANYCDIVGTTSESAGEYRILRQAVSYAKKWFLLADSAVDCLRSSLQDIFVERMFPELNDDSIPAFWTKFFEANPPPLPFQGGTDDDQEQVYLRVLLATVHLGAASGLSSSSQNLSERGHLATALAYLKEATDRNYRVPGDAWMGFQLETLLRLVQALRPGLRGKIPLKELRAWEGFAEGALTFYQAVDPGYCSAALYWDDIVLHAAFEAGESGSIGKAFSTAAYPYELFRFLDAASEQVLPGYLEGIPGRSDQIEGIASMKLQFHAACYSVLRAAELWLPDSEREKIERMAITIDGVDTSLGEIVDEDVDSDDPDLGTWKDAMLRFFPGLQSELALPPFLMVETTLYRTIPKGLDAVGMVSET